MANQPAISGTVKITVKDLNGNNVLKTFVNVLALNFDYNKGMVNVVDATGSFYFQLAVPTTATYTITAPSGGANAVHAFVIS